ncbi:hypothetical protein SAMN05421749_10440 [Acinetobacter marinus]|uniref:SPOR domain-containing protein n=1 Tax=Acinetobacter marinus TaxID=281375 RepID=A0A1G6KEX2_9GAMM|nr:hypothetical protein [Acinetobacter marinus]SDC29629.1 hypothetical protein SAMN05421749_10440 [Acinetobacter marinus]
MVNTAKLWQNVKQALWLSLAITCLVIVLIFWAMQAKSNKTKEVVPVEVQDVAENSAIQQQSVLMEKKIGTFQDEVPPIDLLKRNALAGDHEPEFRGSSFIAENKNAWTLQLLKVAEEDVIRSYLNGREDRSQFYYFRLDDQKKNKVEYVLTYGLFKNTKAAIDQAQKLNFGLPKTVKVLPEKLNSYASLVNDLGSDENKSSTELRSVLLTRTALPRVPVVPQVTPSTSASSSTSNTGGTTTTIQRKDDAGTVQSTNTEHSQVKPRNNSTNAPSESTQPSTTPAQQAPTQIIDPF